MELIQPARPLYWAEIVYAIQDTLADMADIFFVGGMVRDAFRDYPFKDIDMVCSADGRKVARHLANTLAGAYYSLDDKRNVGRAIITFQDERYVIDVAQFRGANLLADLHGRDFTINAMCVPLDSDLQGIYDPLGGMRDWGEKILRRCSPTAIQDDPIRSLRAVRQSLQFGLRMESETRQDLKTWGKNILQTSPERIREEFFALLGGKKVRSALMILDTLGLLPLILPERDFFTPSEWAQTLHLIDKLNMLANVISPRRDDNMAANAEFGTYVYLLDRFRGMSQAHLDFAYPEGRTEENLLYFSALLWHSQIDLETAKNRAMSLRLSNDEIKRLTDTLSFIQATAELYQQDNLDARTIYRFWMTLGEGGLNVIWITLMAYLARQGVVLNTPHWTHLLEITIRLLEAYPTAQGASALLTGDDLMRAFDLPPGRLIGDLLLALREANALGEIQTPQEALDFADKMIKSI